MTKPAQIAPTQLLLQLSRGNLDKVEVTNRLFDLLYAQLHRLASGLMKGECRDHTLQPTALVNEAYLHMIDGSCVEWQDRAHFIGIAARVMRRVLVAHARRRGTAKRAAGWRRITLDSSIRLGTSPDMDLLDLDRVITRLSQVDPRAAGIVEMRLFGGMKVTEVAHALTLSERTVYKDWHFAKLWLSKQLAEGDPL